MKLSLENEIRLKNILKKEDKSAELNILTNEIENKEAIMIKQINTQYINIIKRCNELDTVKNKIPEIIKSSQLLMSKFEDTLMQINEVENEMKTHNLISRRINELIEELRDLEEFIGKVSSSQIMEIDVWYYFNISQNIRKLKNLLNKFMNYKFYDELNEVFMGFKSKIEVQFNNRILEHFKVIEYQGYEIGKRILGILDEKFLFKNFYTVRQCFITSELLDIFYYNEQIGEIDDLINFINISRKSMIAKYYKKNNCLYYYITEIINSYFLIELNKNINDYTEYIMEEISQSVKYDTKKIDDINNKYDKRISNLNNRPVQDISDVLIKLKELMNYLKIEDDKLNEIIGRISIEYFSKDIESKEELNKFIIEGYEYTQKIKNNEINEIYVNKVDLILKNIISNTTTKTVLEDEKYFNEVCKNLEAYYPEIRLRSRELMDNKLKEVKTHVIKTKMPELDKIFAVLDNEKLQEYMEKNKDYCSELYEIIKIKFINLIDSYQNKDIDERRKVACSVGCYYKYLKDNNLDLSRDFKNVADESNNLILKK